MVAVCKKPTAEVIKKSILPLLTLLIFITSYVYYKLHIVPLITEELQQSLKKYFGTILIISVAYIIHRIAGAFLDWYKENVAALTLTKLDDKLVSIFSRTAKVAIWVLALLVILPFYGINISALVAALGVSSLAIALAAQDTIANIIAGFLIMVDSPFRVGDKIKLPTGEVVEVLDIGVRRSKFLSEEEAIIIVPNVNLSKNKIINYTYGKERKA
ncbi:MAG: mechanosensitive ion channel [Candidatus Omnitrophica bacterium]|nr:mechanosensitive ion channel [Candidatus Omnitrophota bacterium]